MLYKIAGIWSKQSEDGVEYLKGRVEFPVPIIIEPGTEILLFKSKVDHPNAPTYDLKIDNSTRVDNERVR